MAKGDAQGLAQRVGAQIETTTHQDFENMTIKEIRLKGLAESDRLLANNEKASVMSVVVYIVVT